MKFLYQSQHFQNPKRMKTTLDKIQSQHLIDLGVPREKASLQEAIWGKYGFPANFLEYAPIFTLADILSILPKEISNRCDLRMTYSSLANRWFVTYDYYQDRIAEELIDALYDLLCWVIENGYLNYESERM